MTIGEVIDCGMAFPHVTMRSPYGPDTLVLEIGGKQFCLLDLSGEWEFYNIKVDPDYSVELRDSYGSVRPGYHMNKKHWVSVDFRGDVPDSLHRSLLRHAYDVTMRGLPKKVQAALTADDTL